METKKDKDIMTLIEVVETTLNETIAEMEKSQSVPPSTSPFQLQEPSFLPLTIRISEWCHSTGGGDSRLLIAGVNMRFPRAPRWMCCLGHLEAGVCGRKEEDLRDVLSPGFLLGNREGKPRLTDKITLVEGELIRVKRDGRMGLVGEYDENGNKEYRIMDEQEEAGMGEEGEWEITDSPLAIILMRLNDMKWQDPYSTALSPRLFGYTDTLVDGMGWYINPNEPGQDYVTFVMKKMGIIGEIFREVMGVEVEWELS
jgi:hypothetical protein